ncbi:MAG: hypothetical protein J0G32_00235 [Alphaproteobacteria bacterium]|nr:hypothetical protein [Alphaproteobacteria bacterium]
MSATAKKPSKAKKIVKEMVVSHVKMSSDQVVKMVAAVKGSSVSKISFKHCQIGDKAAKALIEAIIKNKMNVDVVDLSHNTITKEGVKALVAILVKSKLVKKVMLTGNKSAGRTSIDAAAEMKKMEKAAKAAKAAKAKKAKKAPAKKKVAKKTTAKKATAKKTVKKVAKKTTAKKVAKKVVAKKPAAKKVVAKKVTVKKAKKVTPLKKSVTKIKKPAAKKATTGLSALDALKTSSFMKPAPVKNSIGSIFKSGM